MRRYLAYCPEEEPRIFWMLDLISRGCSASWSSSSVAYLCWRLGVCRVSAKLAEREGFRRIEFVDFKGSLQLLNSSHLRERDKMLLRAILCGRVWNGFLLGHARGSETSGCFSCGRLSCAEKNDMTRKPPTGSQLTETRYAIIACLESARRCESATVVSSRSIGCHPKAWEGGFRVMSFGTRDVRFLESVAPRPLSYCYGFQRARRSEGAVASHLALAARC